MRVRGSEHRPIPYDAVVRAKRNSTRAPHIDADQRSLFILGGALAVAIVGLAALKAYAPTPTTDDTSSQTQAVGDPRPLGGFAELRYGDIRDEAVAFLTAPMQGPRAYRDELVGLVRVKRFGFGPLELLEQGTTATVIASEGLNNRWFPLDETKTKAGPALSPGDSIEKPEAKVSTSHTELDGTHVQTNWIISRAPDNSLRFNGILETRNGISRELAVLNRPTSAAAK